MASEQNGARAFEQLVGELDYPMFIATTAADGERAGCIVGFATQCSIDPPRFLVCLSEKNRTYRVATEADALAVHAPSGTPLDEFTFDRARRMEPGHEA